MHGNNGGDEPGPGPGPEPEPTEDLSGHTITLTKEGTCNRGFNSYTMTGDLTFTYLYYDENKESYYIQNTDNTTYYYILMRTSYSETTNSMYWSSEIEGDWEDLGTETISTAKGEKTCDVMRLTYPSGATETQWIGDEWIPYKIVYEYEWRESFFETYSIKTTYIYKEDGYVEIKPDCEITVIEGYDVTVSGNEGMYKLGQTVTLEAKTAKGTDFGGWYDDNNTLLCSDKTYEFVVGGSQTVYALNANISDKTVPSDTVVNLDNLFGLKTGIYNITNNDTPETVTVTTSYEFSDGGSYTLIAQDADGEHKLLKVKVTGNVARNFTWTYDDEEFVLTMEIDYDDLLYARDYYSVSQRQQDTRNNHERDRTFVTLSYTDDRMAPYMETLVAGMIAEMEAKEVTMTEYNLLDCLLKFTQYIEYQSDEEYMGVEEYWKFPLETLYDQGGDCEDTSILFIAMAHQCREELEMTYDVALQLLPGHMAGAVKIDGYTTDVNPYGYTYGETTVVGFDLGEVPDSMRSYFLENSRYILGYSTTVEIA